MKKTQPPLSPHLQVYRLPLTAWLSITHRMTGVFLVIGTIAFTVALILLANYPSVWEIIKQQANSSLAWVILVALCFSFWQHWLHGLRHLVWDTGSGFDLRYARLLDGLEILMAVLLTAAVLLVHTFSV
ncbi:MAG TPA: succinate dehydrogenase, cytochrome b556 subunit [Crenotrichaceae bacterium]|nr:succinate dehydrogenase, cytochrome b556 subunit [Crenotrichaceae bacterium]